jgi:hypothetical protein
VDPLAGGVGMKEEAAAVVSCCRWGGGVGTKPLLMLGFFLLLGFFNLSLFRLPLLLGFLTGALGPLKEDEDDEDEDEEELTDEMVTEEVTSPAGWKLAKFGATPVLGACGEGTEGRRGLKVVMGRACRLAPRGEVAWAGLSSCASPPLTSSGCCPKLLTGALGRGATLSSFSLTIRWPTLNLDPEGLARGLVNLPGCRGSPFGGGLAFVGRRGRTVTKSACSVFCSGTVVRGGSKLKPWKPWTSLKRGWGEPTGLTRMVGWL